MKLWVDDIRPAPDGYIWVKTVEQAKSAIHHYERNMTDDTILLDLDHDSGEFGEDYIKILDWLEEVGSVDTGYFFHIHSQNVVGVENMRRIIKRNNWREIF